MKTRLQYGKTGLDVEIPGRDVTILRPQFVEGLPDEHAAFQETVRNPIGSQPLKEIVNPAETLAVVIPDITRPFPSSRILPWLFEELSHLPPANITIITGTGSHRPTTDKEILTMVGEGIARRYSVVDHSAYDKATLSLAGKTSEGQSVFLNKHYVQADKRIILGFIEPHFMAGFSGGWKAVFPGITDIESIMRYHQPSVIADPRSTWGVLEGNPTQEQIRACGSLLPVDFCINVTLNSDRAITRFFCGEVLSAHENGCAFAKSTAMARCKRLYPMVITTNGGYPLDQNLYQSVKGICAAAQIVEQGGWIVCAAKCTDGFPAHGNFRNLLFDYESPESMLAAILAPGFSMFDQWEAQKLAMAQVKARVALYSDLPSEEVQRAHLYPIHDINRFLIDEINRGGTDCPIAVLPEGPMTIPYLEE